MMYNPLEVLTLVKGKGGIGSLAVIPDAIYMGVLVLLFALVIAPFISTFRNMLNRTDEVIKIKERVRPQVTNETGQDNGNME